VTILITAVAAALVGALGPFVLNRLPEPDEPDPDKIAYATLARTRMLAPGLAAAAAVMAGLVAWRIENSELLAVWVVVTGVGAWLSFVDWHTRLLPYRLVVPTYLLTLFLVALASLIAGDWSILVKALVGNVVVYVTFRLLYWVAARFFRGGFGYGDVRWSAVLGLALGALGASETIVGMYAGFLLGAVCGLVLSRLKVVDAKGFAFGPYMVVGAVIGVVWGPAIYSI